ncbi:MAG: hypothetical protein KGJ78_14920 [Alphaproteobacteria bacterium]|nr:hypothetical protein [Alphaproteobacteria bacterium]
MKRLHAVATALLLGTATVAAAGIMTATPAEAAVRAAVGKPLQEAIAAVKSGNCQLATAKIRQAEGVGGLSAEEQKILSQTKQYAEVTFKGQCGVSSGEGAQAKFDADYRAGKYSDAINDEDLLRKYGVLNASNMVIIAQAYYRMGNYRGCVRYAASHTSAGLEMLDLQARCAFETGDDEDMRTATEQLVVASPTPEHWNQLINLDERAKGLTDPQTLDIYRIKYLTGGMTKADDYFTLAQLLLAAHLPNEALNVIQKGVQAHILVDQRSQRLLALAKQSVAGDLASLSKTAAAAKASKTGDELVKLGEDYCGMGKYAEAIAAIVDGIKKGVKDPDNAQVRLAQAYNGAGQKPAALNALAKADKTPNGKMVARLWSLYIRSGR